ncbi:uncharacterized protein [Euwallacea fornicatus]|uniref:uncharacterized protein isoform X1 n=1 Tax=Euwallacea fornicatus TaxID=995702 RepID=UPI00338FCB3E
MGQHTSKSSKGLYLPLFFNYKNHSTAPKPLEPIKFQYNLSKKNNTFNRVKNVLGGVKKECKSCANSEQTSDKLPQKLVVTDVPFYWSETSRCKYGRDNEIKYQRGPTRANSEPNLRVRNGVRRRCEREERQKKKSGQFGYEIEDVDEFLSKATLEKPANIPVVLAFPSILYQTRVTGYQAEIALPLGMVVNAIFRNQNWLYVQTPHAEEGYLAYTACLPLGIIPPRDNEKYSPCWERSTDVFPKPGSVTDTEKTRYKSEREDNELYCPNRRFRAAFSTCGEKSVDRLYLRAAAMAKEKGTRRTLLVINEDFNSIENNCLSVMKNEVVFLLNAQTNGWFYVKNKEGREGFIPSVIAGHGFL